MGTYLWSGRSSRSIRGQADPISQAGSPPPQRIAVMGPPGSGKSTVARYLGARLGLPVYHLDQIWWQPGWIEAPAEVFAAEVGRIAALPAWVIDGNFTSTIGPRFRSADMVVYLDIPAWLSLIRVLKRLITAYGRVRPDMARGCPEKLDLPFLWFTANWNRDRRLRNLDIVAGFGGRTIVLRGRRSVRRFTMAGASCR